MNRGNLAEDPRVGRPSGSRYAHPGMDETNHLLYVSDRGRKVRSKGAQGQEKDARSKVDRSFTERRQKIETALEDRSETESAGNEKSVSEAKTGGKTSRLEVGMHGRLFAVVENQDQNQKGKMEDRGDLAASGGAAAFVPNPPVSQTEAFRTKKPVRTYLEKDENPLLRKDIGRKSISNETAAVRTGSRHAQAVNPLVPEKSAVPSKIVKGVLAALVLGGYIGAAVFFNTHFYPGSSFFGIASAGLTVAEVKEAVQAKVRTYALKVVERGADGSDGAFTETLTADEIGLSYRDDGAIDTAMAEQKSFIWPAMMIAENLKKESQALPTEYDGEMAEEAVLSLQVFDRKAATKPVDPQLMLDDTGAYVSEAVPGNTLDYEAAAAALLWALDQGATEIDLNEEGLYEEPAVLKADSKLNVRADALNKVLGAKVTLDFEDRSETIGSEEIVDRFLSLDMDGAYYIDEEKVRSYVERLAYRFDTYYGDRTFYTSLGTTVELSGGDYGWMLDQEATYDLLLNALREGQTGTLEPVYSHTAFARGVNDIGDTYVEIDITNQRMWCYKDGILVVDTPVVTGNPYRGNETPAGGVWEVDGMFRNAVLKGRGYSSPVSYWIPYNGNVGIHDLSTRYYFGGTIYKGYGSHGCINTPLCAVKLIFNSITSGTPVVVYEDESDEALAQQTGSLDIGTITYEIEERFGTVDDEGHVIPGETEAVFTDDGNKGDLEEEWD